MVSVAAISPCTTIGTPTIERTPISLIAGMAVGSAT